MISTQGRLISTPRYNGMRPDLMNEQIVTTSNDTVVIRDRNDEKGIENVPSLFTHSTRPRVFSLVY